MAKKAPDAPRSAALQQAPGRVAAVGSARRHDWAWGATGLGRIGPSQPFARKIPRTFGGPTSAIQNLPVIRVIHAFITLPPGR
jgi:hypothetical protein